MADTLDIEGEVRALFEQKLKEFAAFCASTWQMSEADFKECKPDKSPEYLEGYNAALSDGISQALDCWCEEIWNT